MPAISDNLIHFLGRSCKDSPSKQFEIFKTIIINGLKCSKIQVKFGTSGVVNSHVVCFTDIPLSYCDEHAAVYGKFGIGFKKSFVKNRGGNPARYFVDYFPGETGDKYLVENRGLMYASLCDHFKVVKKIIDLIGNDKSFSLYDNNGKVVFDYNSLKSWADQQIALFSFEKEMGDLGPARDETREMDLYYKEREWKLVPMHGNLMSGVVEYDEATESYTYKFERGDINVVITPNNEIRTQVLRFFLSLADEDDTRLKRFSEDLLPVVTYDDLHKW